MNKMLKTVVIFIALSVIQTACTDKNHETKQAAPTPKPETKALSSLEKLSGEIPVKSCPALDTEHAMNFAALSLGCVDREYPNKPGHAYDSADQIKPPREVTAAFYGCYDWHSAVHGHWAMVRILKKFPDIAKAKEVRTELDKHLLKNAIEKELAFFNEERGKLFERPYGWGWLLRLYVELITWDDPQAKKWAENVKPLAELISQRTIDYLGRLTVPIRDGTHSNTAFSLVHAFDYARTANDEKLLNSISARAKDFYMNDEQCPTDYEPSGEDFISSCFAEADLMRRVLPQKEFETWFNKFMPAFDSKKFTRLLAPVEVKDLKDPRIGHLIGLSLQRAWAMKGVSTVLSDGDKRKEILQKISALHCNAALSQMFDSGYGGEHWLASFAVYHLTDTGIAGESK